MWGKSFAAVFLAPLLAVALVGIVALLSPSPQRDTLPALLMFYPVWIGVIAVTFLFKSGARAWLWLGGATALGFGLLYAIKASGLVRLAA